MDFLNFLQIVENEPLFETGLLLVGDANPSDVRKQLSRWCAAGKVIQLRRGLYTLAQPYRKATPHPFVIANKLQPGSYVSCQSALAYYAMIPEAVPVTISVTTGRPDRLHTELGDFDFQHIQFSWFRGYNLEALGNNQHTFIAPPEKALLDLVYLQPKGDSYLFLESLRLQALEQLNLDRLSLFAKLAQKPKLLPRCQSDRTAIS